MTFVEKLKRHKDGLVRLNAEGPWFLGFGPPQHLLGKIGTVVEVDGFVGVVTVGAHLTLFIDGNVYAVLLYEREFEFLQGPLPLHEKISPVDGQN